MKYSDFKTVKQVFDWPIAETDPATWTEEQHIAALIAINLHEDLFRMVLSLMENLEEEAYALCPEYYEALELVKKLGVNREDHEPK